MSITYFLGANSRSGFYSLYDSFPPSKDCFLHIIKGGPGNGKSGFMRRIAAAAESKGLDVEYVLCSGDPDSLDGIYIPALKQAWCDGTAPHVTEPEFFGVTASYVNLGELCTLPISAADRAKIRRLSEGNKALYRRAYSYLAAAANLDDAQPEAVLTEDIKGHIGDILGKLPASASPWVISRFFSAISCKGYIRLADEIKKLCGTVYTFGSAATEALDYARQQAQSLGQRVLLSPNPLDPDKLSAVLLPEHSIAFVSADWGIADSRLIGSSAAPAVDAPLIGQAIELLANAKALHDEMEAVYKPYMDFAALDSFTAKQIQQLIP